MDREDRNSRDTNFERFSADPGVPRCEGQGQDALESRRRAPSHESWPGEPRRVGEGRPLRKYGSERPGAPRERDAEVERNGLLDGERQIIHSRRNSQRCLRTPARWDRERSPRTRQERGGRSSRSEDEVSPRRESRCSRKRSRGSSRDPDMPVPDFLKQPHTLYEIAEQYWDLHCYPTQYVFSLLAQVSDDKLEREKCIEFSSPEGQEDWLNYCRRPKRTVLEVLHDFHKSASKLTLEVLFELFSTIKPRSFSIASSALPSEGHNIDLLVAVVHYHTKLKKPRLGLASNWLKSLETGDRVYGWIKAGTLMFPNDATTPHILIGPGTGLAPFRSLLQEREVLRTANKEALHLIFGCRYKEKDFHCREELERMVEEEKLSLYCAFSRDQENKVYVQHKIAEQRELLWQLITNQAYIYISGNAKNMPDNVRDAFIEDVISKAGRYSLDEAKKMLKDMENSGRFQVEAW